MGSEFLKAFGAKVRAARRTRGLTQEALAAAARLEPSHVSRIEQGAKIVRLDTIERLARALGIQASDLMPPMDLGKHSGK